MLPLFLNTGVTMADLKSSSISPDFRERLSMCVKEGAISWAAILSSLVFRSKPSKQVLSFKLSMDYK